MKKATFLAVTTMALAAMLSGCSNGKKAEDPDATPTATTVAETAIEWPDGMKPVKNFTPVQGTVGGVSISECGLTKGKQTVTAEVTSASSEERDFVMIVRWVNPRDKELARVVVTEQGVAAGETVTLTATKELPKKAASCRPVVFGGTAG